MKTDYKEVWDWRVENENKPIWARNPKVGKGGMCMGAGCSAGWVQSSPGMSSTAWPISDTCDLYV